MSAGAVLSSIFAIVLSLAFVIALAWGALWLLRKFQDGSFGRLNADEDGVTLRFERALPVGPRERIVIVEVEGERMMLGVTAQAITPLKSWPLAERERPPEPVPPSDDRPATARPRFRLPFADGERA